MQLKVVLLFLVIVSAATAFRFNRNYRQKPRYNNNNFMNAYLYSKMSGDMDMFDMPEFNYYNYMMSRFAGSQNMNAFSKYTLLKEMDYF